MNRDYDFTNDTAFGPFYTDEKSIWKRYFLYKNRVGAHDPDSMSYKLQQIYRKLWGDDWLDYMMTGKNTYEKSDGIYESIYKRNPMESNKKIPSIYGETLNTPTTALNGLLASAGLNSVKQQTIFYKCHAVYTGGRNTVMYDALESKSVDTCTDSPNGRE